MFKQVERIVKKFGGVPQLAAAMSKHPSSIYKWFHPRKKGGTDGLVPTSAMQEVLDAALVNGVNLSSKDFDPR